MGRKQTGTAGVCARSLMPTTHTHKDNFRVNIENYNLFTDEIALKCLTKRSLVFVNIFWCVCVCVSRFDNIIKAPGENLFSIVVVISAVLIWTVKAQLALLAMMP